MSRKVLVMGSNKVVAEALPVHVGDTLDDAALSRFNSSLYCGIPVEIPVEIPVGMPVGEPVGELVVIDACKQVDYVTRAYWLQTALLPHFPNCKKHYKIRAFSGASSGLDLTLKPAEWSQYYAAYNTGGNRAVAQSLNDKVAAAWDYLKENERAPIIVTCYRDDEAILERLEQTWSADVYALWHSLPDRLKKNMRVAVAFLSTGKVTLAHAVHAKDSLEANIAFALAHKKPASKADVPMHADVRFNAAISEAYMTRQMQMCWNQAECSICTVGLQRVPGNMFSDAVHSQLSPGTYTRDDVLARVKTFGEIVKLHDPCYKRDAEIMTVAFNNLTLLKKTQRTWHCNYTLDLPDCLKDSKAVVVAAVGYDAAFLRNASDRLQNDLDVCRAAVSNVSGVHIRRSVIQRDPVVAAYILVAEQQRFKRASSHMAKLDYEPQVYQQTVLDQVANSEQRLGVVFMVARNRAKKKNPFWKAAASKLVQDEAFIKACVKANWRTVQALLTKHWRQLANGSRSSNKAVFTALLSQLLAHFGPARLAAHHHIIRCKYWTRPDLVLKTFQEL